MISKSEFYEVKLDKSKNFFKLKINGFWGDESLYAELEEKIKPLLIDTKPGWKMMVDLSEIMTPPQQFGSRILQIQQVLVKYGLKKIAEVVPQSIIAQMAVNRIANSSGLEWRQFSNLKEAMAWLTGS